MIIEVLLLVVLLGALLYRLLSIFVSQWSLIDGVIKGRNNYIHWKLSANLLGGLQKALISGNALVFLTTSLHSLTEVTTSSMVSVNFLMITSFSSPSHCFYHIPNDKTTLHANVPINATHNLMVRMQVSLMVDIFRKPHSFCYSILAFLLLAMFHSQLLRKETHERVHNGRLQEVQAGAGPQNTWMVPFWKTSPEHQWCWPHQANPGDTFILL